MQIHEFARFFFQKFLTKNQIIVKKFWKYIAIAALTAVMAPLTACDDDSELGPKDKANYEANFAYCLESDNNYSTLSYRYSGKLIENDEEVLQLTPVRLTKPAPENTTVEIAIDPTLVEEYNAANGTNYVALTNVAIANPVISIAEGAFLSADSIKIDLLGNQALAGNTEDMLVPVVIKSASNGIAISKTSRVFVAFTYSANVVSLTGSTFQAGTDESLWAEKMANVEFDAVSSIFTADANTTVKFEIDNSLIAEYNETFDTEYVAMNGLTIEDAVIIPGEKTAKIRFNITDYSELATGYVVPVRIASIEGDGAIADETANIAYFVVCKEAANIKPDIDAPEGTQLSPEGTWKVLVNGSEYYDYYGTQYSWTEDMFDDDSWSGMYINEGDVVVVDLGSAKTLTTVAFKYYAWYYGVTDYKSVRTSVDGNKWTNWKNIPNYYGYSTTYTTFGSPTSARYIEMVIGAPGYNASYGSYISDIFIYGK